jgi:hypothetical protein
VGDNGIQRVLPLALLLADYLTRPDAYVGDTPKPPMLALG